MASKQDTTPYTNSLAGQSKEDIICSFAYSLATASALSTKEDTKTALLQLWRKCDISEEPFSDKQIRKYKTRALLHDESFERLAALLKEGTSDRGLLGGIASRVFMDMSRCLEMALDAEGEIKTHEGLCFVEADGKRDLINWTKVRWDWAPAVAYLRTFLSMEDYRSEMEKRGLEITGFYKELVDNVLSKDSEMLWFINRSFLPDDKRRITKYNNASEYFMLCMDNAYERLTYIQERIMLASGSPEFGAFRGHAISSLINDAAGMRSGYDILLSDEMGSSILNREKPGNDIFAPPDECYFDFWTEKGILREAYEYARMGIDILAICRAAKLTKKDASSVVKEAFMCYEIIKNESIGFTSKKDREAVTELISRLWVERAFERELSHVVTRNKKSSSGESVSKMKKTTDELKKKVASLEKSLALATKRADIAEKVANDGNKALLAEIAALKKDLKEKDRTILEQQEDIDELKELFIEDDVPLDERSGAAEMLTEDEFLEYIRTHRVLVWGLREETAQKFRAIYPELSFASSERRLTKQQLEAYEVLLMSTNFTGHGNFFAARDTAKRLKMPMAYLAKTDNSPAALHRALEIAVFGGAKALH